MSNISSTARFSALAAAVFALAPKDAAATTYSGKGWAQLQSSASDSASTTVEGNDFGIGYTAFLGLEGYNWDIANNTITTICSISIGMLTGKMTVAGDCAPLPAPMLSSSVTATDTWSNGDLVVTQTTTTVWDVPDVGAMARADGYFSVPATLFGEDFDLLKLTATSVGNTHGADTIGAGVYVGGAKIASASESLPFYTRVAEECVTLAEVEAEFTVGFIPVTLSASADGCIYLDASAKWETRALSGTLTPGASVDVTAKAGVGGEFLGTGGSAGVYGNITLIDASLPLTISAAIGPGSLTVSESAKLTMTGLDGELGLYAEGCLFGACVEATLEVFDWTGLTYADTTIFSASQSFSYL
jgi:hypothetical protein